MNRSKSIIGSIDWVVILIYLLLVFIGYLAVYSTGHEASGASVFDFSKEHGKQLIWLALSLVLALITINIEGQFFKLSSWLFYGFTVLLLILVLIIGKEINGAKAWIRVAGFTIQPAEFAKLATALVLARFIANPELKITRFKSKLYAFLIVALPVGLVVLQPDIGSAIVAISFIFPMYREGMSGNIILVGIAALFVGVLSVVFSYSTLDYWFVGEASSIWILIVIMIFLGLLVAFFIRNSVIPRYRKRYYSITAFSVLAAVAFSLMTSYVIQSDRFLKKHHKDRIELLLGVADEKLQQEKGYNMKMARTAIGSGGWLGKGYLQGPMTEYNFVPEQNTDFIFTAIGEEFGFLGSFFVILLYLVLIMRLIFLSERQRSQFSRVFGYCIAAIFFIHFVINIGMVLGLAPVIGIPLPFISKGGSSLLAFTLMIFIFLRLDGERYSVIARV